jgi:hypothetical protein
MRKPHIFHLDIYKENFYFFAGASEYVIKSFFKRNKIDIDLDFKNDSGNTIMTEFGIVIWLDDRSFNPENLGNLAHEANHAANYILKDRGIRGSRDNDEAASYLIGYIVKECSKALR